MARTILITSGKGGVGKTTLTSNLAVSLSYLGSKVIAVDANLTTPNLGIHAGMYLQPNTIHDVLRGSKNLKDAIYPHAMGVSFVPASMSVEDLQDVDVGKLPEVVMGLREKADFVLVDSAAGLGREAIAAIQAVDEVILITNPDLPSVVDALKTAQIAQRLNKKILGVVVNRIRGRDHEMTKENIEGMIGHSVIAEIPEDIAVSKSIAEKHPLLSYDGDSPAAFEIRKLAYQLSGIPFTPKRPKTLNILERLVNWMVG